MIDKVDMSIVCQPALVPVLEKGSTQTTGKGEAAWGRRLNKRICLERNQIQARDGQGQALQWNDKAQLRASWLTSHATFVKVEAQGFPSAVT